MGVPGEGISTVRDADGPALSLADVVAGAPDVVMGQDYAATHDGLGRLAKIFDYGARIPFHIHPPLEQARRAGRNSKDEAYYFPPGVDLGEHPESFLGLHPSADRAHAGPGLLGELQRWDGDGVLQYSRAYQQVPEDGYFIPSGVLHARGPRSRSSLQEESDAMAMFQALNAGTIIDKALLFKDVCAEDRDRSVRRRARLGRLAGEHRPLLLREPPHAAPTVPHQRRRHRVVDLLRVPQVQRQAAGRAARRVRPERRARRLQPAGLRGRGTIGGVDLEGGRPGSDELLVTHDRAVRGVEVRNTGDVDLLVVKIFGPDINVDAPRPARVLPA